MIKVVLNLASAPPNLSSSSSSCQTVACFIWYSDQSYTCIFKVGPSAWLTWVNLYLLPPPAAPTQTPTPFHSHSPVNAPNPSVLAKPDGRNRVKEMSLWWFLLNHLSCYFAEIDHKLAPCSPNTAGSCRLSALKCSPLWTVGGRRRPTQTVWVVNSIFIHTNNISTAIIYLCTSCIALLNEKYIHFKRQNIQNR